VIIKFLFAMLVLSSVALIVVAVGVSVRVWRHLKRRKGEPEIPAEAAQENRTKV
jgi:hypothetical protein